MNNAKEMAEKGFNTGFTDAEGHELHVGDYVRICNDDAVRNLIRKGVNNNG